MTPRYTKAQFTARTLTILAAAKAGAEATAANLQSDRHLNDLAGLAQHDPILASLVAAADAAQLGPLNALVKYLASRVDN